MKQLLNENYNLISNFLVSVWIYTIDIFTSEINKILADKRTFAFSIVEICTIFLSDITIYYCALKWHFWYLYILYHLEITLVFSCTFVHFCFYKKNSMCILHPVDIEWPNTYVCFQVQQRHIYPKLFSSKRFNHFAKSSHFFRSLQAVHSFAPM